MINTVRLRAMLGWLGMLLPWIVLILSMAFGYGFPQSISATYFFDPCITPFMIILGSAGFLLISYRGYDKVDDIICTLAGISALAICLFPCFVGNKTYVGTFQIPVQISGNIHNISAAVFFGLLAFNSLFLFTKSSGTMTKKKKIRNVIFRACGIGMALSLVILFPLNALGIHGSTWIVEAIALIFFGISWLTKSNIYPWLFAEK